MNCSTLQEQAAGSLPSTSQVSFSDLHIMTSCQLRTKLRVQPRLRTRCPSQLPWRPGSHGKPQEPPCHHSRSCPRPYECQDAFPPALCLQAALRLLCVAASFPGASSCRSAAYCGLHKQLAFPPQCCLVQPVCSAPLKGLDLPSGMGLPARCALAFRRTSPASTVHASAVGDEGHTAAGGWKASSLKAASSLNIQLWSCHSGRSASPAPVAGFGFACDRSLQFQERHTNNPTEANPCSRTPGPRTLPPNPAPRPLSQAFPSQCCLVQPVCNAPLKSFDLPSGMGLPARCALAFRRTSPASTVHASAVGDEGHAAVGGWKASSLKAASSLNIQLWSCHSARSASPAPVAGFGFACNRSLQFQGRHTNNPTEANPCSRTSGPRTLPQNPASRPLSQAFPSQRCLAQTVCSAHLKGLDLPSGMGLPARCALAFRRTSPASTVHAAACAVGDEGHAAVGGWKASSLKAASSLNIQLWSCHSGRSASPAPVAGFGFACDRSLQFQGRHAHGPNEAKPCSRTPGPRTLPPRPPAATKDRHSGVGWQVVRAGCFDWGRGETTESDRDTGKGPCTKKRRCR